MSRYGYRQLRPATKRRADYESPEQQQLMNWLERTYPETFDSTFAIPNGGARDGSTGAKLKREGVKRGVPDLMLAIAKGGYHGLFIEMKATRPNNSPVSKEQKIWISRLIKNGYCAKPAIGISEAMQLVEDYLSENLVKNS